MVLPSHSSMASPAQPDSLDANHDRFIISTAAVFSVLACLALTLRLTSKGVKKSALSCDDYLAIGSWVLLMSLLIMKFALDAHASAERTDCLW